MKKFCIECGKEAGSDHQVCIHCGTPLPDLEPDPPEAEEGIQELAEPDKEQEAPLIEEEAPITEEVAPPKHKEAADSPGVEEEEPIPAEAVAPLTEEVEEGPPADKIEEAQPAEEPVEESQAQAASQEREAAPAASRRKQAKKKAKGKKSGRGKKVFLSILVLLLVLLAGAYVWLDKYSSLEATTDRFVQALANQDQKKVQDLLVHEDRSAVAAFEAEAFIQLVKEEGAGYARSSTKPVVKGKILGLFDAYKFAAVDQVPYGDKREGLSYTFNGEELPVYDEAEDYIAFGPIVPGIYKVGVNFASDFGDLNIKEEITIEGEADEYFDLDLDIPLGEVSFYLPEAEDFGAESFTVLLGKERISIDQNGETGPVGTLLLDGSVEVKVEADLPWGVVESDPIPVEETEAWLEVKFLDDSHWKDIQALVSDFSEQYLEALATRKTKPMKRVSKEVKSLVEESFEDGILYTGQVERIGLNQEDIYFYPEEESLAFRIFLELMTKEDFYGADEEPSLTESLNDFEMILVYDEKEKEWTIDEFDYLYGSAVPTETWKGAGKLYGPDKKTIEKVQSGSLEEKMSSFLVSYTLASVQAINARDFDLVSDYITKDGPRRKEARDYIDYLDSKDIYEEWIDTKLKKIEEVDGSTWKVTMEEEFIIIRPDSRDQWRYETVVHVKEVDGDFLVDELISTDRIN